MYAILEVRIGEMGPKAMQNETQSLVETADVHQFVDGETTVQYLRHAWLLVNLLALNSRKQTYLSALPVVLWSPIRWNGWSWRDHCESMSSKVKQYRTTNGYAEKFQMRVDKTTYHFRSDNIIRTQLAVVAVNRTSASAAWLFCASVIATGEVCCIPLHRFDFVDVAFETLLSHTVGAWTLLWSHQCLVLRGSWRSFAWRSWESEPFLTLMSMWCRDHSMKVYCWCELHVPMQTWQFLRSSCMWSLYFAFRAIYTATDITDTFQYN